jgi:hypothetical protein
MPTTDKSVNGTSFHGVSIETIHALKSKSERCQLYRKVIVQALKDAAGRSESRRLEVGAWVLSRNFLDVCKWSGVHSDNMRQGFRQVLLGPPDERRSRCDRLCLILESARGVANRSS